MKVLLATDGSDGAKLAARLVGGMAWPDGSAIRVIAVIQPTFDPAIGMPALAISNNAVDDFAVAVRAEAIRVSTETARSIEAPRRVVEVAVLEGRPASVIVDDALEFGADLIVVGSHGRGAVAAAVLGSVSAEVAESARCSVLVARSPSISRLVLADDRSEHSEVVRHLVATMPGFRGLHVQVVSVEDRGASWYGWLAPESGADVQAYEDALEIDRGDLIAFVGREVKKLSDIGLIATAGVRDGDPGTQIVAAARDEVADLIVMGSRGRTRLTSVLLGSVSRKVLSHAPCSVLIVRRRPDRPGAGLTA
jgi:nucleotide-binding universal stress UspA family protein